MLHSPPAFLATVSNTTGLNQSLWDAYKDTPDLDVDAAQTLSPAPSMKTVRGVKAVQLAPRVTCPAPAPPTRWTLMLHASQGNRISLHVHQAPGAAGLWRVLTPPALQLA